MFNFVMPALTAIGINSGMNLLRGKPLFQNTGTAAVTGGVLGGFGQPGGIFGSTPVQTARAASNTIVPGSIESVMGQVGADGVFRNPEYFANILGNPVFTGNEGLLSQIGTGAGSIFDMAKTNIPDYVTPQNLLGVSNILSNMNNMPRPVASGANTITGTPPKFELFQTGQVYTRKRGDR
jgi:hypothetical protein